VGLAHDDSASLAVKTTASITKATTGFVGVSDGISELKKDGSLTQVYHSTGDKVGNVAMTFSLNKIAKGEPATFDVVLGFGKNNAESVAAADKTLARGYEQVLAHYNGDGEHIGWKDY